MVSPAKIMKGTSISSRQDEKEGEKAKCPKCSETDEWEAVNREQGMI